MVMNTNVLIRDTYLFVDQGDHFASSKAFVLFEIVPVSENTRIDQYCLLTISFPFPSNLQK